MIDDELKAIRRIVTTLEPLEQRTRNRVLRYVNDLGFESLYKPLLGEKELFKEPLVVEPMQCREPDLGEAETD